MDPAVLLPRPLLLGHGGHARPHQPGVHHPGADRQHPHPVPGPGRAGGVPQPPGEGHRGVLGGGVGVLGVAAPARGQQPRQRGRLQDGAAPPAAAHTHPLHNLHGGGLKNKIHLINFWLPRH